MAYLLSSHTLPRVFHAKSQNHLAFIRPAFLSGDV
jgi:hypothetical protein